MLNKVFQENAKVIYTRELAFNTFETMLQSPNIARHVKPGQFINILPSDDWPHMMRRPMSVASQSEDSLSIIYKVVGSGTQLMRDWKEGQAASLLGPLGNFWDYGNIKKTPVLIGGGVGIAPIINLKNALEKLKIKHVLVMGAQMKRDHFLDHNSEKMIYMTTDDGSLGIKGTVIEALNLIDINKNNCKIFACGPPGMMEAVKDFSINKDIDCDLALETIMACGVGICQGCTVEMNSSKAKKDTYREKYALACIDGPIFNAKDIKTCYL